VLAKYPVGQNAEWKARESGDERGDGDEQANVGVADVQVGSKLNRRSSDCCCIGACKGEDGREEQNHAGPFDSSQGVRHCA
jgi:hypothetical protein